MARNPAPRVNAYLKYTGMALQMGAILFFCIWIGQKIDHHFGLDKPWFTMALVLLGFIGTIYSLNLQLREDNK